MQVERTQVGWGLWLRWVLATALGYLVGGAVSGAVVSGGETRWASVTSPLVAALVLAVTEVVAFGAHGAAVGIAQGITLRHSMVRSGWWVVATTGGWAVGGAISGSLAGVFGGTLTGVGPDAGPAGIVVTVTGSVTALVFLPGLLQWLVLRRQVGQAGWWVLASAVSFFVAIGLSFPLMVALARTLNWGLPSAEAWGLGGALVGLLDGAITGAVLVRLLRQSASAAVLVP
jgi:hypothetical protein